MMLLSLLGCSNIGAREFYLDIKDFFCITLKILFLAGPFDGLDFVGTFMKCLGLWSKDRHMQQLRQIAFFATWPEDTIPDIETHMMGHLSGNQVCSETSKMPCDTANLTARCQLVVCK